MIGHRGTGSNQADNPFPENTIASFAQAVSEGATMVELDVQLTSDGALVVMHDDTVDRTTGGTGCVADLSLDDIRALSADGEPVPTLEEVFAAVAVGVNVEIKVSDEAGCPATDRPALAAELTRILEGETDRTVVVSSFDLEQLQAVRTAGASAPLAYLFVGLDGFAVALAEGMDAHPLALSVRAPEVTAHHEAGLAVRPYTVNDAPTMERLLGLGVDGIVTDAPDLLVATKGAFCESYECPMPDAGVPVMLDGGVAADGGSASDDGGCSASGRPSGALPFLVLALLGFRRRALG